MLLLFSIHRVASSEVEFDWRSRQFYPILIRVSASVLAILHRNAAVAQAFSRLSETVINKSNGLVEISVNSFMVTSYLLLSNRFFDLVIRVDLIRLRVNATQHFI